MCGIAGFNWDDRRLLAAMASSLCHRGPDASGLLPADHGGLSLAHTRLSIIDLNERSNQPFHYEHQGRRYTLVFNGEIYNFRELRCTLEREGFAFHTTSDTEVIAAAYARWGADCVVRFNGMWAFALIDHQTHRALLSRDRFGKKPLYYFRSGARFIFASEIKALLAASDVPRVADAGVVSDFLNFGLAGHSERTFFRGVLQLPAATNGELDLRTGEWRTARYYDLPSRTRGVGADEIAEQLRKAVARRLIADVPICLSLSGGVDSSCVAAVVADLHRDRMVAFTTTSGGVGDETENVRQLLSQYPQFELVGVPLQTARLRDDCERIVYHMDEPFIYDSPFARWRIAEAIGRHGFKVSLTGEGADELLGGYAVTSHVFLAELLRPATLGRFAAELLQTLRQPDRRAILGRFVSRFVRSLDARLERRFLNGARAHGCRIAPGAAGRAVHAENVTVKQQLRLQITTFFLPYLLTCNDKMYMAHGVESRAPFLDVELAELLLSVPTGDLISGGVRKAPLRYAMRGRVPDAVLFDRRKIGFASTLRSQLGDADNRGWVRSMFDEPRSAPFIDRDRFLAAFDRVPAGSGVTDFMLHALSLELWMRRFEVAAVA